MPHDIKIAPNWLIRRKKTFLFLMQSWWIAFWANTRTPFLCMACHPYRSEHCKCWSVGSISFVLKAFCSFHLHYPNIEFHSVFFPLLHLLRHKQMCSKAFLFCFAMRQNLMHKWNIWKIRELELELTYWWKHQVCAQRPICSRRPPKPPSVPRG